ncbi:hemerythrin domain-containing protein [Amphritea sp. 1_MG-2023]|uniref:hemerythrin domain-containing protein n=1 Tax=Amphritea sp. 1_MG-2023 TaxID=3062670 RepID=UPI0026E23540|nr:hemerythrin domain-containing protein [Amphritea sp. 1_MG-2023]MDO6563449.1 hemerythrin domain-containing protein [Amphritea sp. 1_MG-2023]
MTTSTPPTDDFSQCHIRILQNFEQLRALGKVDITNPVATDIQASAKKLLTFYHEVVLNHHHEEEQELFNIVMDCASPGEELHAASRMIKRLTDEHRALEQQWKNIEAPLKKLAQGRFAQMNNAAATALADSYLLHAKYEESHFLPLAATILKNTDLESLGLSLHTRHNIHQTAGYM